MNVIFNTVKIILSLLLSIVVSGYGTVLLCGLVFALLHGVIGIEEDVAGVMVAILGVVVFIWSLCWLYPYFESDFNKGVQSREFANSQEGNSLPLKSNLKTPSRHMPKTDKFVADYKSDSKRRGDVSASTVASNLSDNSGRRSFDLSMAIEDRVHDKVEPSIRIRRDVIFKGHYLTITRIQPESATTGL